MRRPMRRLRRYALFLALVVGSIAGVDQWLFHGRKASERTAEGQGAPPQISTEQREEAVRGPFASRAACEAALRGRSRSPSTKRAPRLGTWNVRWFPFGTANGKDPAQRTDIAWLACAIALLDVDVLAVQEFLDNPEGRSAALDLTAKLDALTGGRHRLELDDCTGNGRQHVGLLWNDERVQLSDVRSIAALNPAGSMCASSLRPGLGARARFVDGTDLHVISVHLDSGEQQRDFDRRAVTIAALDSLLPALRSQDEDLIILGDFNAMGCERCTPTVSASDELRTLDASLSALELRRLVHPPGNQCTHYYRGQAGLLDLAIASAPLKERLASVRAEGACAALECGKPKRGTTVAAWQALSDHCPLVIELKQARKR